MLLLSKMTTTTRKMNLTTKKMTPLKVVLKVQNRVEVRRRVTNAKPLTISPGPIVDASTDGIVDQQFPSVDETTLKKAPIPQEENDAPIVENDDYDEKDESDNEEDDAAQGGTEGSKQSRSEKKSNKVSVISLHPTKRGV
ncbi:hypothetical protein RYX36_011107 [Vicia faba]